MKVQAVEISLRPYKGRFLFAPTRECYERTHIEIFGDADELNEGQGGRFCVGPDKENMRCFLIWARGPSQLAHEVAHVVLELFLVMDTDPRDEGAEPFCYLIEQLYEDCLKHLKVEPAKRRKKA